MLTLIEVCKYYQIVKDGQPEFVLRDINWQVEKGRTISIMGPSGSGKSTLLNLIGGLDTVSSGQILLDGQDITHLDDIELAKVRNTRIGFIFQLHHLLPQCTVLENVLIPTLAAGNDMDRSETVDHARSLLAQVGLNHRLRHLPAQLSGGERQRVAVVRALINRPRLLLADEPTGSLDADASNNLTELLLELNAREGVTLIVATHARELAERMNHRYTLVNGKLYPIG